MTVPEAAAGSKTGRAPAALLAALLLSALVGGCSLAGRTVGGYVDDKLISRSVRAVSPNGVKVDTFESTVYLSGEVDTQEEKSDAEIAAWRTAGVAQVVNDLRVRRERAVSALPRQAEAGPLTLLQVRLPGIARLDPALPGAPALAYDRSGAIVATVYVRPLRRVMGRGVRDLGPTAQPITHVALYPVVTGGDQPEPLVTIVLWHVSPAAAAALE